MSAEQIEDPVQPRDATALGPYWWSFRQPIGYSHTRKMLAMLREMREEVAAAVPEFIWEVERQRLRDERKDDRGSVYTLSYRTPMRAGIIASYEARTGGLSIKHSAARDWYPDGDPIEPALPIVVRIADERRWRHRT